MTTRLLGIQIAHGFSPEAQVFASLLPRDARGEVDAQVLFHHWPGSAGGLKQFGQAAQAGLHPFDFGWRSIAADRSLGEKMRARLHFHAVLPRALSLARALSPAVIYSCQQRWDCEAATFLARRLGKPQIIHLHYTVGSWLHQPVLDRLLTCDHVIAISDFVRDEALRHGVPAARVTVIRNTLAVPPPPALETRADVRRELGMAPDVPLTAIIARLDPVKGQEDTLRAFARIAPARPDARLLVVGSESPWHPSYGGMLQTLAEELGIGARVQFLGHRADVPRLLAALDVFMHPSRSEPFGLATAEACAAGLPIIAYAEGGTGEIVTDGETGLLAPAGDVEALAERLAALLDDPARARQMGQAGRRRMETKFQPAAAARQFAALVQQVGAD